MSSNRISQTEDDEDDKKYKEHFEGGEKEIVNESLPEGSNSLSNHINGLAKVVDLYEEM